MDFESHQLKLSTEEEVFNRVKDADVLVVNMVKITDSLLSRLPKCKLIIRVRNRMINAARQLLEGQEPAEPFQPEVYSVRSANFALPEGESLEEAVMAITRPWGDSAH